MAQKEEVDAEKMLEAVWAEGSLDRIRLPVDPFYIAKVQGIRVFGEPLSGETSGLLRKRSSMDDPEIILNTDEARTRQRFTCAHELGHFNMRTQQRSFDEWNYVDERATLAGAGTDPAEMYANGFAAALLMPRRAVEKLWDGEIAPLAATFGVSPEAMTNRLKNLKLL